MRTLEFLLGELLTNLRRNGILTVAAVMTVMASLSILSLFYLMHRNLAVEIEKQSAKAQISAFLKKDLEEATLNDLRSKISALPGVAGVEYVSSEAALERMLKSLDLKPEEKQLLGGQSRLPAKFAVRPSDPNAIDAVAKQLTALEGVEDVRYGEKVVAPLNGLKKRFQQFGWGALVVLSLATCGIISNAIRLTIYARRREIRIMQLVGATDGFIRLPFLMEGLVHGLVGGALAVGVTSLLYGQLCEANRVLNPWLKLVSLRELMPAFAVGLLLAGMIMGAGSSALSIRAFLKEA